MGEQEGRNWAGNQKAQKDIQMIEKCINIIRDACQREEEAGTVEPILRATRMVWLNLKRVVLRTETEKLI